MKSSILIIYTGGTIGMKEDPQDGTLKPFDFSQIKDEVPELNKFDVRIDSYTFDPLIDSSDMEPSIWVQLAQLIAERYEDYDGFVILHGTDTMAYSASALSFMLEGLTKPVIFTGSQLPIGVPRTDGKENLISAVEIAAAKDHEGHARVPEVCIFFDSKLLRGNRSTKYSAEAFNAFASPNCPPLAEAGINIRYNTDLIRKPVYWDAMLRVQTQLDTRVAILKVHPGMTPQVMRAVVADPLTRHRNLWLGQRLVQVLVPGFAERGRRRRENPAECDAVQSGHREHGPVRYRSLPQACRRPFRGRHYYGSRPGETVFPDGPEPERQMGENHAGKGPLRRNKQINFGSLENND